MDKVLLDVLFTALLAATAIGFRAPKLPVRKVLSAAQGVGQSQLSRND